jgi:hypothetical protein
MVDTCALTDFNSKILNSGINNNSYKDAFLSTAEKGEMILCDELEQEMMVTDKSSSRDEREDDKETR